MLQEKYLIGGLHCFVRATNDNGGAVLHKELQSYERFEDDTIDLIFEYVPEIDFQDSVYLNPKHNGIKENCFTFDHDKIRIEISLDKEVFKIRFCLLNKRPKWRKFVSAQYNSDEEMLGQYFHDLVLIPTLILTGLRSVIHASSVVLNKNHIAFGGTGGVGKTSLEIEHCYFGKAEFVSDDILIINGNEVYHNLAYPKIYGYNLEDNKPLKKDIFKEETFLSKFNWNLRLKILGSNKVRRRINPKHFYNWNKSIPELGQYYLLVRSNTKSVKSVPVELETLVEINMNIIQNEFMLLFAHIRWYENNCILSGIYPLFNSDKIMTKLEDGYSNYFEYRSIRKIEIPINMNHREWLSQAKQYFDK